MNASDAEDPEALHRLAAIGRQAGEVAHDVRNLLGVVLAAAEQLPPGADPEAAETLDVLRQAAGRAASLLLQLLRGQVAPAPRLQLLGAVLAQAVPLIRQTLGPGIALELLPGADGLVLVDAAALERVWLNLARNARVAMGDAGTLTIAVTRVVRADSAGGERRLLCVSVQDSGPGFPARLRGHLGRPFAATQGGTGLGLSSVASIVADAGGTLELADTPGQGARLLVLLPESDASAALPDVAGMPQMLLVEDEPSLARLAERFLTRAGWQVLAVASAEAALDQFGDDRRPQLVVTDLALPGLDGITLIERLRQRWPDLPAILTSGYAAPPARLPARTAFLAKPYALRDLLASAAKGA